MDAHPVAAFYESVSDLSQRHGGTESTVLRKKAFPHPKFQSGHYGGRLSKQPAPSGRIEAPSSFVLAVPAGFEYLSLIHI